MPELGGSRARQLAKLANGNIPCHGHCARFMNGGWLGGRNLYSCFYEFESSPVQEFKLFQEFHEICEFWALQSLLGD